jgi:hypothetical protein|nr:MAG TPA: hypothetical protein [Caudoviricetes sp.]
MAIYRVENGKAPAGLSAGDEVVTGGGTYRITGVNADGSYQSQVSNKAQTTKNYKGQYTQRQSPLLSQGVSGYTQNRINGLEGGYTPGSAVQQAQAYLNQVQSRRPGEYQSQWDGELTDLYNRIANRKPFSYDLGTDPVYQQYREQYQRQGRLAMQDTMGQAAALTGGYGSTYGEQVGQQAYNAYLQNLNDIVPDLYNAAYNRYRDEGTDLYNQYGLLSDRENQAYSRYRDTVNDYYSDLSDARSAYDSAYSRDYNQWSDQLSYWAQKAANENSAYLQQLAAQSRASGGSGGGSGGSSKSKETTAQSGKGYIDNTYNKGGVGGVQSKTYDQLKRGMYEWLAMGQKDKAYELFQGVVHQLNLGNATGKKQYNELASILNKAGFGIPLE